VPMRVIANKRCRVMIEPPELQAPLYPTPRENTAPRVQPRRAAAGAAAGSERSALIYCTSGSG
jgi:hypothetical protein